MTIRRILPTACLTAALAAGALLAGAVTSQAAPVGQLTEFAAHAESPGAIVAGPDGNMWFVGDGATLARISPAGQVTTVPVPSPTGPDGSPSDLTTGPDGNVWFTFATFAGDKAVGSIGRVTPSGLVTWFTAGLRPPGSNVLDAITAGPDGNLWFADDGETNGDVPTSSEIGRITPSGQITEFSAGLRADSDPEGMAAGPDGSVWFADASSSHPAIGRITPDGQISEFSAGLSRHSRPTDITKGADGNLWFTDNDTPFDLEAGHVAIGRITPTGHITEFSKGLLPANASSVNGITAGPDGNVWFLDGGVLDSLVGRVTPSGHIVELRASIKDPTSSGLGGLAAGPSGTLWLTDSSSPGTVRSMVATGPLPRFATAPKAVVWTCRHKPSVQWECSSRVQPRPLAPPGPLRATVSHLGTVDATGTARFAGPRLTITMTGLRHPMLVETDGYVLRLRTGHSRRVVRVHLD